MNCSSAVTTSTPRRAPRNPVHRIGGVETSKGYIGAKKVGVVAVSHKVIDNLLAAVRSVKRSKPWWP